MSFDLIGALNSLGADTAGAVQRFGGNAALYERFLLKFPEDDSFRRTGEAREAGDWEAMLAAAHTLKGVSGNLGLTGVYEASSKIVSSLRGGDRESAGRAFQELDAAYQTLLPVLEQAKEEA